MVVKLPVTYVCRELKIKMYCCIDLGSFPIIDFQSFKYLYGDGDVSTRVSAVS